MSENSGRLAQLARALARHARGHRFESYIAHHETLTAAIIGCGGFFAATPLQHITRSFRSRRGNTRGREFLGGGFGSQINRERGTAGRRGLEKKQGNHQRSSTFSTIIR